MASVRDVVARCRALWPYCIGFSLGGYAFVGYTLWYLRNGDPTAAITLWSLAAASLAGALLTYILPPFDLGRDPSQWPVRRLPSALSPSAYRQGLRRFGRRWTWLGVTPFVLSVLIARSLPPPSPMRYSPSAPLDALAYLLFLVLMQGGEVWLCGWGFQFLWIARFGASGYEE